MLTKNDLQAIRDIVDERLDIKLEVNLEKKLKPIKRDISKIKKDIGSLIKYEDEKHINLRTRVERIEDHLQLTPLK